MAQKYLIPFLVAMMLVTGVCNTILTKYQVCGCSCRLKSTSIDTVTGPAMHTRLRQS